MRNFRKELPQIGSKQGIVAKRIHGGSASAPLEKVCQQKETVLPGIIPQFELWKFFNVDETGLFWKLIPARNFKLMGDKHAKDRITELVGASALG